MQHVIYHAARASEGFLCCMDASTRGTKLGGRWQRTHARKRSTVRHEMAQIAKQDEAQDACKRGDENRAANGAKRMHTSV